MSNAKAEFPAAYPSVRCAKISNSNNDYILKEHHTKEEFDNFLNSLDFNYDSGYGNKELFGTIWMHDDTYYDRGEYDGSEWWEYHKCPEIPDVLKDIKRLRNIKINEILKK